MTDSQLLAIDRLREKTGRVDGVIYLTKSEPGDESPVTVMLPWLKLYLVYDIHGRLVSTRTEAQYLKEKDAV